MLSEFSKQTQVPFSNNISPLARLPTISYRQLVARNADAISTLVTACKTRGFFHLDLTDSSTSLLANSIGLGHIADTAFNALTPAENFSRYKYPQGTIFGYKPAGAVPVSSTHPNRRDTTEFFNVPKDQILASSPSQPWPDAILANRTTVFRDFTHEAHATCMFIVTLLAEQLGIDPALIANRHRITELSGNMVRLTRSPPRRRQTAVGDHDEDDDDDDQVATPSHTDYGTITLLFNWLGGLQVWSNPSRGGEMNIQDRNDGGRWEWVQPKHGCAIVNLGDAACAFTNGVLCSARHRVVPAPPGEQGEELARYSVVYFVRPEDEAVMERLPGRDVPERNVSGLEVNAERLKMREWILRRSAAMRAGR